MPFISARRHRGDSRVWGAILDRVLRRPAISLALGAGLLIALALPALGMHTMNPGAAGLPRSLPIMRTYDRMQAAFPGGPMPAMVVVHAARRHARPRVQPGIRSMLARARAAGLTGPSFSDDEPRSHRGRRDDPAAGQRHRHRRPRPRSLRLRGERDPGDDRPRPGHGDRRGRHRRRESIDFNDVMKARLPIVFAFVLGVAFVLLLVTFRSVVVPMTAIALNLLSVGAAYGVVKLIFQDGNLESVLGFQSLGGVVSWLPLFLFVVLFGLSMDYNVFILSRIREGVDAG